ncbi:ABC transporter substrate-binding protein [Listeria costaricensis]|uniref:ABC transporter substrate-binding protein n=1 Tax=Listeria costaricensis TaxID=2026604 RepID=UPI000C06815F|nr:ABC transporter substrate-binding protein [Listeria costaricensis]
MDQDYFQLRFWLKTEITSPLSLQALAKLWYSSPKNAKRKLLKYQTSGLLVYQPGSGRGHLSKLAFAKSFQDDLADSLSPKQDDEQLSFLLSLLKLPESANYQNLIMPAINQLLGASFHAQKGEIMRAIVQRRIGTLHPSKVATSFESFLIDQLGDSLFTFHPKTGEIRPWLAHHFDTSDHKSWIIHLRKGVFFHHEREMDSEDVMYSLKMAASPTSVCAWKLAEVDTMQILDRYTIEIRLKRPNVLFLRYLCSSNMSILPRDLPFDENQWVSTGPFKLTERNDERIILTAFNHYFSTRPLLDQVEFWFVPQDPVAFGAQFSHTRDNPEEQLVEQDSHSKTVHFLAFNFHSPLPFIQHQAFREAIYHLAFIEKWQAEGILHDKSAAHGYLIQKEAPIFPPHDLAKIHQLLLKSGYDGRPIRLGYYNKPWGKQLVDKFRAEAAKVNIPIIPVPLLMADYYRTDFQAEADLFILSEESAADLEVSFLDFLLNPALAPQKFWPSEYKQTLLALTADYQAEPDKKARQKSHDTIESWLLQHFLLIYLFFDTKSFLVDANLKGMNGSIYGYFDLRNAWFDLSHQKQKALNHTNDK